MFPLEGVVGHGEAVARLDRAGPLRHESGMWVQGTGHAPRRGGDPVLRQLQHLAAAIASGVTSLLGVRTEGDLAREPAREVRIVVRADACRLAAADTKGLFLEPDVSPEKQATIAELALPVAADAASLMASLGSLPAAPAGPGPAASRGPTD